jgi:protein TonB
MKLNKLGFCRASSFILFALGISLVACNNSDKSANNSTTDSTVSKDNTMMNTNDTSRMSTPATDTASKMAMDTSSKMKPAGTNTSNTKHTTTNKTTGVKRKGKVTAKLMAPNHNAKVAVDKLGYYNYTDEAPVFKGGQSGLETYFNNNLEYPQEAIDNNVEGTVNVRFSVDENGTVGNATAIGNKLGNGLDEAAEKAVMNMPKWAPGKVKGKTVKAWYTLPVTYRLDQ